jgi:hypothetical protein
MSADNFLVVWGLFTRLEATEALPDPEVEPLRGC